MADTRRCIGSARFGIEPHDAPVEDFPKQASQKDGFGRMCRTHWNEYTKGLARDAKARKSAAAPAAAAVEEATVAAGDDGKPAKSGRGRPGAAVEAKVAQDTSLE